MAGKYLEDGIQYWKQWGLRAVFEGQQNITSGFATSSVPTLLMRQGIFTEATDAVFDPYNVARVGNKYLRQPLPTTCVGGTCYPAGRAISKIDPIAAKYLALYPLPTNGGINSNYSHASRTLRTASQYNARIDENWNSRQRTFIKGSRDVNAQNSNDYTNSPTGTNASVQTLSAYIFAVGHTWTLSPSTLLQFTYGFAYQQNATKPQNFQYDPVSFGFSSNFLSQQQIPGLPAISITGENPIGTGSANVLVRYTHVLDVLATLQRGKHSVTTGYNGRYILDNEQSLGNGVGTFTFDHNLTSGPDTAAARPTNQDQFDAFAAFLLGVPSSTALVRQATLAFTQPYHAIFVQDDWRIASHLTLNMGVRYDIELGFRERYNRWADFGPTLTNPLSAATGLPFTGGNQYIGVNGNPGRLWKTQYKAFAPRFGFAYNPNSTTVFRGGYGLIFLPTSERGYAATTLGFTQQNTYSNLATSTPMNTFANPFTNGVLLPGCPSNGVQYGAGTSVSSLVYDTPIPYQQQWNFGIQQLLSKSVTFSLNYAGSHGVHLPVGGRPDDLQPQYFGAPGDSAQVAYLQKAVPNPFQGTGATGNLAGAAVPRYTLLSKFPQYFPGNLNTIASGAVGEQHLGIGSASYNALQASVIFRTGKSLSGSISYGWSKLLGNVTDLTNGFLNTNGNPGYQSFYAFDRAHERSVLTTDIPHRVVSGINYSLPFGRGQRFAGRIAKWADQIVGGWKLNAFVAVESGTPLSLSETGNAPFSGTRPSYVPGINPLASGKTRDHLGTIGQTPYLDPATFRISQSFEFGSVPRSAALLRSPLIFQDDLSTNKNFPIHESIRLQFRLEAFNALNKVQFGFPSTQVGNSSFGKITSQANLPRNVQLALKLYF